MTLKNLSEKATMKLLTSSNCEQQIVITKNVCFLGKKWADDKKEEKVWPKKLLITDMKKNIVCYGASIVQFCCIYFWRKKNVWQKKDKGKLFPTLISFWKWHIKTKIWLNPTFLLWLLLTNVYSHILAKQKKNELFYYLLRCQEKKSLKKINSSECF